MYGTEGSYEEQVGGQMWATKDRASCTSLTDSCAATAYLLPRTAHGRGHELRRHAPGRLARA